MCIQMKWLENCSDIVSKLEIMDHLFSTYAKFSEKLTSGGKKCKFSGKLCVRTKWMISKITSSFNPLTHCFHKEVIHTEAILQLTVACLLKHVWPSKRHQTLNG